MAFSILIITPTRSFGELIRQALQEVGYAQAEILANGTAALAILRQRPTALVILDFEIEDIQPQAMVKLLREDWPKTRLLAVSFEDACSADVSSLLDVCLPKPFYLPELIEAVDTLARAYRAETQVSERPASGPGETDSAAQPDSQSPSWLRDINRAAQYLTRLSLETTAQAALIARGSRIWAYAGQLPQEAAAELALSVSTYWTGDDGSDLVRFLRLESVASEYLLYATGLGADYILALAFETEMPFTKIRRQAAELADKLANSPVEPIETELAPPASIEAAQGDHDPPSVQPNDWLPEDDLPAGFPLTNAAGSLLPEGRQAYLANILATIDVPEPGSVAPKVAQERVLADHLAALVHEAPNPERSGRFDRHNDAQVQPAEKAASLPLPVPIHYQLSYACVMVPRLRSHLLVGSLPALLNERVQQLCQAYNWRLDHLALRPDYAHWVISAAPETSPATLLAKIRQYTSDLIFSEQPRLAVENPSGDFWAAGYLLINNDKPLAARVIQEFLEHVRAHQGLKSQPE